MKDRFNELLQAVGDRKIANDLLSECTDAKLREKLTNYIQEKDDIVCSILSGISTKPNKVYESRIEFKYDEDRVKEELKVAENNR